MPGPQFAEKIPPLTSKLWIDNESRSTLSKAEDLERYIGVKLMNPVDQIMCIYNISFPTELQ